ncbi:MAG: hypothetical protein LQ337_008321, partial [Flavoplaca oasis]
DSELSRDEPSINDTGFTVLQTHEDATADIVFVHGLQGHPRNTWTCERHPEQPRRFKGLLARLRKSGRKDASTPKEVFWPLHFLPQDCADTRILTWGFDSKVSHFFSGAANQSNISAYARNLLAALKIIRLSCLLCRAAIDADSLVHDIYSSTEAILFLGTPHRGSSKAEVAEVVRKIISVSGFDTSDQNIRALQINSFELEYIHENFMRLYERQGRHFKVLTFQEAKGVVGTSYLKFNERTINANHMEMCRFPSKESEGYKQILGEINIVMLDIRRRKETRVDEEAIKSRANSPSQMTTSSSAYSLDVVERECVAILAQNVSNAAEYKSSLPGRVEGTWATELPLGLRSMLCYFFCDEKIEKQRDSKTILRSLIHQLIIKRRQLIKYIKTAYEIYGPNFDQDLTGLWRILVAIASDKLVGPVTVVVDAIDECEETTRERFLQNVVSLIERSKSKSPQNLCIKFIVTSRPLLGCQYATQVVRIDPSQNQVEQDLKLVIRTRVDDIFQRIRCKPDVKEYLENALYSKADRTFLWVTLVLHHLEKSFLASRKDFKRIIDEIPQTLLATYDKFLGDVPSQYQPLAGQLLRFLIASSRPLTLDEMRILVAIRGSHHNLVDAEDETQPNIQTTLEGVLGPLVRIWDRRIYLVHQSLKEYLQTLPNEPKSPLASPYSIDQPRANLLLAESCVSYLMLEDFDRDLFLRDQLGTEDSPILSFTDSTETESTNHSWSGYELGACGMFKDTVELEIDTCVTIRENYPLFDYASRHWAAHFASTSLAGSPEFQRSVMQLLDGKTRRGSNWLRYYWRHNEPHLPYPLDVDPIVTASYFGHSNILKTLVSDDGLANKIEVGISGMYWASRMGHDDVVNILLEEKVNPNTKYTDGETALTIATRFDRIHVVERLLEDEGFIPEANEYRHSKIRPEIADSNQWTPLFWSVFGNHLDVLKKLLSHSMDTVNYVDGSGRDVLSWAAALGAIEFVEYLMGLNDFRVRDADYNGRTALSWAAENGHLEVILLLRRSKRIDVSMVDKDGRNAISWACSGGHYMVVDYLINHDPEGVDKADVDGWTPLAWATCTEAPELMKTLLRSELVYVNKKDKNGRSVLSYAAGYGYSAVVKILLAVEGINVDSEDNNGRTPLIHASRHPDIIKMLQETKA